MPTALLWPGLSIVVLYLHSNGYRSATVAGRVMLAIDAGAELLGLPSITALPALVWH